MSSIIIMYMVLGICERVHVCRGAGFTGCFCSIVLASIITIMMVLLVFASAKAIQKTTTSKFEVLQVLSPWPVSPLNSVCAAAGLTASPGFLYSSSSALPETDQ